MTNQLTVFTKPWPDKSLPELAQFVKNLGFDGIELPVRPGFQVTPETVSRRGFQFFPACSSMAVWGSHGITP